jgi:hypothetical protein
MPWFLWVPFAASGIASVTCFTLAYAHLTPEARAAGSRLSLRGALTRQDIFTPAGWRLRMFGWIFAGLALLVLVGAGLHERGAQGAAGGEAPKRPAVEPQ